MSPEIPLTDLEPNSYGVISSYRISTDHYHRLNEMGFVEDSKVAMIRKQGRHPVIIGVAGTRYAISRELADNIYVRRVD